MNSLPSTLEEVRNLAKESFASDRNRTMSAVLLNTNMEGLPLVYVDRNLVCKSYKQAVKEGLMSAPDAE